MRLSRFRVEGLFGLFDHSIPLNTEERITILHAPNGYGKTIVLKMISNFFGGSLNFFRQYEFARVGFEFTDGSHVEIEQLESQKQLFPISDNRHRRSIRLSGTYEGESRSWNPDEDRSQEMLRRISVGMLERHIPFLQRLPQGLWRDTAVGDKITHRRAIERYADQLPFFGAESVEQPEWLSGIRSSLHCRLIETQRLITIEEFEDDFGDTSSSQAPAVKAYAAELAASIGTLLAESATLSQSLDQTFPSRLLSRVRSLTPPPEESKLRDSLLELEAQRSRLARAGLIETSDEGSWIAQDEFNETTRRILAEYIDDTKKKLSIYHVMLAKLELFTQILNSRYQFKSVSTNRSSGFLFKDFRGRTLAPESLSSGEQHELVLVFDLLFKTNRNTLILIDEPEISLHVGWQKRFLQDLRQIISLTEIDAVLATHSPQLIGRNLDLTVQLQGPNGLLDSERD